MSPNPFAERLVSGAMVLIPVGPFRSVRTLPSFAFQLRVTSYFLYDKVVGIVGLGRIGTDVAKRLKGFEPRKVLYYDLFRKPPEVEQELGVEYAPLEELLKQREDTLPAGNHEQLQLVHRNGLRLLKLVARHGGYDGLG